MVIMDRTEALKNLLAQDPANSFVRYGLAQAYAAQQNWKAAVETYRELLTLNPDYVAAYYHGGQALEKQGDVEGARELYERGIEACGRTGDGHTRTEIQAALDLLP
jgi:tetratricopeptide (TPR) repeat protein